MKTIKIKNNKKLDKVFENMMEFKHLHIDIARLRVENDKLKKQLNLYAVSKSFTADRIADMLANEFTTIEEAINFFDKQ